MTTNHDIIERLREKRNKKSNLSTTGIESRNGEVIIEAHNASKEAKWLTYVFREIMGTDDYNKTPIQKARQFRLNANSVKKLISGEFQTVVESYINYVISKTGTFRFGKDSKITQAQMSDLFNNISNTIQLERRVGKLSSELCAYLDKVNTVILNTRNIVEFDFDGHVVVIYNMENCHKSNYENYVRDLTYCLGRDPNYPELLLSNNKNKSIYYSEERGLKALSTFDIRKTLVDITHEKTLQNAKNKYLVLTILHGTQCNVVEMAPLIKAIQEIEVHYTYYMVCSILDSQLAKKAEIIHESDIVEAIPATSLIPKDYILELLYKKACEFGDTALGTLEARLIKEMKYAFTSS